MKTTHSIQMNKKSTNVVKFGDYAICLEKDQLAYYFKGSLTRVVEVSNYFTQKDLFDLATKISNKNNFGVVEYTSKALVVNKY